MGHARGSWVGSGTCRAGAWPRRHGEPLTWQRLRPSASLNFSRSPTSCRATSFPAALVTAARLPGVVGVAQRPRSRREVLKLGFREPADPELEQIPVGVVGVKVPGLPRLALPRVFFHGSGEGVVA